MLMTYTPNHVKRVDDYGEFILNEILVDEVDYYICHSLRTYRVSNLQANRIGIAFKAHSQLAIRRRSTKPPYTENQNVNAK